MRNQLSRTGTLLAGLLVLVVAISAVVLVAHHTTPDATLASAPAHSAPEAPEPDPEPAPLAVQVQGVETRSFSSAPLALASASDAAAATASDSDAASGPRRHLAILLGVALVGAGALGAASRHGRRRFLAVALIAAAVLIALLWTLCSGSGDAGDRSFTPAPATTVVAGGEKLVVVPPPASPSASGAVRRGGKPPVLAGLPRGTPGAAASPSVDAGPPGGGPVWGPISGDAPASWRNGPVGVHVESGRGPVVFWWTHGDSDGPAAAADDSDPGPDPEPSPAPAVPEPGAALLFAAGLATAALCRRRRPRG